MGFSLKERKENAMNPHVVRIVVEASIEITKIFIEKWIDAKIKNGRRKKR
jgi:hypothetical protein